MFLNPELGICKIQVKTQVLSQFLGIAKNFCGRLQFRIDEYSCDRKTLLKQCLMCQERAGNTTKAFPKTGGQHQHQTLIVFSVQSKDLHSFPPRLNSISVLSSAELMTDLHKCQHHGPKSSRWQESCSQGTWIHSKHPPQGCLLLTQQCLQQEKPKPCPEAVSAPDESHVIQHTEVTLSLAPLSSPAEIIPIYLLFIYYFWFICYLLFAVYLFAVCSILSGAIQPNSWWLHVAFSSWQGGVYFLWLHLP